MFSYIPRQKLAEIITLVREIARPSDDLLKEETPDESIRAEVFSYIPRQKLAEIITLVREIARPSDDPSA
ncbi:hypothetical protein BZY52_26090 [Enterobacter hormaechei]|nr:hypothetical protein BZY52_26090 [Enterobacter hormaechei]